MDVKKIEELIIALEASHAVELLVSQPSGEVHIRRGSKRPASKAIVQISNQLQSSATEETKGTADKFVTAPMVGIYHRADSDLKPGGTLLAGQTVGSIESMKIHNEVTSNISGVILDVLVEDGTPVEYGQHLCRIAG
jgi:acetyl-CoA carboxylase biotin carboxyl carrier protein